MSVLAILGPTASGKSQLAMAVAQLLGGEIVACDAMTVYRGLDVGTAKATASDRQEVRHHLIDVVDIGEAYDVQRYVQDARAVIADCDARGAVPILCGGSGLYARSLLYRFEPLPADAAIAAELKARFASEGIDGILAELTTLDPASAARTRENPRRVLRALEAVRLLGHAIPAGRDTVEPAMPNLQIVLMPAAALNRERIAARTRQMLSNGWLDEVRGLTASGLLESPTARQAIGYGTIASHLADEITHEAMVDEIVTKTCRYAKRQRTWFRNQHPGAEVLEPPKDADEVAELAAAIVAKWRAASV